MLDDGVFRNAAVDAHRRQTQGVLDFALLGLVRASIALKGVRSARDALIVR